AEDGIRDDLVTGVQTCALPISDSDGLAAGARDPRPGMDGPWRTLLVRADDCLELQPLWPNPARLLIKCGNEVIFDVEIIICAHRSEERRVGKEVRSMCSRAV